MCAWVYVYVHTRCKFFFKSKRVSTVLTYFPRRILRVAPILWPDWVAPLFEPACRPITVSPARNCSSVNSRLHSSAGLGPKYGPFHSGCLYVYEKARVNLCNAYSNFKND
ncbi:hypothetical protein WN51_14500 [Melipona quadrifasciata]|uniref:Uncharacterized protein n=1 Tax=Melipona quadrifasciata TaxID=166423 RepID=A0A0N0BFK0_9HYME|nr:hypothetical protein WN51_14500 [Melipona quadrifasciata]